jgi:hypothetical protein
LQWQPFQIKQHIRAYVYIQATCMYARICVGREAIVICVFGYSNFFTSLLRRSWNEIFEFKSRQFLCFWSICFSQIHAMTMHIKFWQQHCNVYRQKNLITWRDSNPGSSVLEADAMTTMPRRQGSQGIMFKAMQHWCCETLAFICICCGICCWEIGILVPKNIFHFTYKNCRGNREDYFLALSKQMP